MLYGMSDGLLRKVQSIQNAAARLVTVTGVRRCDHITPVLRQLHWLPVRQRVEYKVACLVHQSLAGQTPAYIADDIQLVTDRDRCQLRSATTRTCLVPRTHNNFGDRSFNAAGPRVWNSLPPHLRQQDMNFARFKRQLKTLFYFVKSTTAHCDCLLFLRHRNILTYLLTYLLTTMTRLRFDRGTPGSYAYPCVRDAALRPK